MVTVDRDERMLGVAAEKFADALLATIRAVPDDRKRLRRVAHRRWRDFAVALDAWAAGTRREDFAVIASDAETD